MYHLERFMISVYFEKRVRLKFKCSLKKNYLTFTIRKNDNMKIMTANNYFSI